MLRYISDWRTLGRLADPCRIRIPRRTLYRVFLTICAQAFLYCLLPTPFMLYTLPVGVFIVFQLYAFLQTVRRHLYARTPPALLFIATWIATLCARDSLHTILRRLYVHLVLPLL